MTATKINTGNDMVDDTDHKKTASIFCVLVLAELNVTGYFGGFNGHLFNKGVRAILIFHNLNFAY